MTRPQHLLPALLSLLLALSAGTAAAEPAGLSGQTLSFSLGKTPLRCASPLSCQTGLAARVLWSRSFSPHLSWEASLINHGLFREDGSYDQVVAGQTYHFSVLTDYHPWSAQLGAAASYSPLPKLELSAHAGLAQFWLNRPQTADPLRPYLGLSAAWSAGPRWDWTADLQTVRGSASDTRLQWTTLLLGMRYLY